MGGTARQKNSRRQNPDSGLHRFDDQFCRTPEARGATHRELRQARRARAGDRRHRLRLRDFRRATERGGAVDRLGQACRARRRRPHRQRPAVAMTDARHAEPDTAAVSAGMAVLDRFLAALNARDQPALLAAMHFPHYRLAGVTMRVWEQPDDSYLAGFYARAGEGWHHTKWDFRRVVVAGPEKIHFDVQ